MRVSHRSTREAREQGKDISNHLGACAKNNLNLKWEGDAESTNKNKNKQFNVTFCEVKSAWTDTVGTPSLLWCCCACHCTRENEEHDCNHVYSIACCWRGGEQKCVQWKMGLLFMNVIGQIMKIILDFSETIMNTLIIVCLLFSKPFRYQKSWLTLSVIQ